MPDTLQVTADLTFDSNATDQFVFSGTNVNSHGDLSWPQSDCQVDVSIVLPANGPTTFDITNPIYLAAQSAVPTGSCPTSYQPGSEFSPWSLSNGNTTLSFTDYNNDGTTYLYALNVTSNGVPYVDDPKIINREV